MDEATTKTVIGDAATRKINAYSVHSFHQTAFVPSLPCASALLPLPVRWVIKIRREALKVLIESEISFHVFRTTILVFTDPVSASFHW